MFTLIILSSSAIMLLGCQSDRVRRGRLGWAVEASCPSVSVACCSVVKTYDGNLPYGRRGEGAVSAALRLTAAKVRLFVLCPSLKVPKSNDLGRQEARKGRFFRFCALGTPFSDPQTATPANTAAVAGPPVNVPSPSLARVS